MRISLHKDSEELRKGSAAARYLAGIPDLDRIVDSGSEPTAASPACQIKIA